MMHPDRFQPSYDLFGDDRVRLMAAPLAATALGDRGTLEYVQAHNESQYESMHDPLTGLVNRRGLALATRHFKTTIAEGTSAVIIIGDLDGQKRVNDDFGHELGDLYIITASHVMVRNMRHHNDIHQPLLEPAFLPNVSPHPFSGRHPETYPGNDIVVARTGGDEFAAVVFVNDRDANVLDTIARSVTQRIEYVFKAELNTNPALTLLAERLEQDPTYRLGMSTGYTVAPGGTEVQDLTYYFGLADQAARHNKLERVPDLTADAWQNIKTAEQLSLGAGVPVRDLPLYLQVLKERDPEHPQAD